MSDGDENCGEKKEPTWSYFGNKVFVDVIS